MARSKTQLVEHAAADANKKSVKRSPKQAARMTTSGRAPKRQAPNTPPRRESSESDDNEPKSAKRKTYQEMVQHAFEVLPKRNGITMVSLWANCAAAFAVGRQKFPNFWWGARAFATLHSMCLARVHYARLIRPILHVFCALFARPKQSQAAIRKFLVSRYDSEPNSAFIKLVRKAVKNEWSSGDIKYFGEPRVDGDEEEIKFNKRFALNRN